MDTMFYTLISFEYTKMVATDDFDPRVDYELESNEWPGLRSVLGRLNVLLWYVVVVVVPPFV